MFISNVPMYVQIPVTFDWLNKCYSRGNAHGAELVVRMAKTMTWGDHPRDANEILQWLVDNDWIYPDPNKAIPTESMRFLGLGGRPPGTKTKGKEWPLAYPVEYRYSPNCQNICFMRYLGLKSFACVVPKGYFY